MLRTLNKHGSKQHFLSTNQESNVIIESRKVEFFENLLSDSNSQVPTSVGKSQKETTPKGC